MKNATYSPWAGTDSQITDYIARYYPSGSNKGYNMYAASGLRYNFEKIKFKKQTESETYNNNKYCSGYYTEISKNGTVQTGEIDGTTFKARNNVEVRLVIHSDITRNEKSSSISVSDSADKKGLFILQNYTPDKHTTGWYWLASPDPTMTNVKMQKKAGNSHVWKIVD